MDMKIKIKRIYENADTDDGYRMLIDRLWPRGIKKTDARLDEWNKNISPSSELRKWFNHQPERFASFKEKYIDELKTCTQELKRLKLISTQQPLTLLYAAKNPEINNAVILLEVLQNIKP